MIREYLTEQHQKFFAQYLAMDISTWTGNGMAITLTASEAKGRKSPVKNLSPYRRLFTSILSLYPSPNHWADAD